MVKKQEEGQYWDNLWAFYSDMFQNMLVDKIHHEEKTHWVLGISALVMSLTLNNLRAGFTLENSGFIVIFGSSLIAFLFSLIIFEVPSFFKKVPHSAKSLMYYRSYRDMSPERYAEELRKIKTINQVSDQYAYNICNIVNRNNAIKRKMLKIPVYLLFWGILIGFALIVLFSHPENLGQIISISGGH